MSPPAEESTPETPPAEGPPGEKTTAEKLVAKFLVFRKTFYFRILYLVLLGLVVAALYRFLFTGTTTACLGILLIPVSAFVFPYWLGERSTKNFALNTIPIYLIAALLIAGFYASAITGEPVTLQAAITPGTTPTIGLYNGTVAPFSTPAPAEYNFTVRVFTAGGVNNASLQVFVNLTPIQGLNVLPTSTHPMLVDTGKTAANGTWYYYTTQLDSSIYVFGFYSNDTRGNQTQTDNLYGPIAAPYTAYYFLYLYFSLISLLFPFSFYFIVVFLFWYTGRMRQMRSRSIDVNLKKKPSARGKEEADAGEKPEGTAGKKPAGFTCTNCGADVTEEDEKCPKCGAVFED